MAGPEFRVMAKDKSTGAYSECAVVWKNDKGQRNLVFTTQAMVDSSGGKKILAATVIKNPEKYFLNVYENTPQGGGRGSRPAEGSDTDEF